LSYLKALDDSDLRNRYLQDIKNWHDFMISAIQLYDPYHHLVTTSTGGVDEIDSCSSLSDFRNVHEYSSFYQGGIIRPDKDPTLIARDQQNMGNRPKPFFYGEVGFDCAWCDSVRKNKFLKSLVEDDPNGFHLHNILWSSMFSGSIGPASFWWYQYLRNWDRHPEEWNRIDTNKRYYHFYPVYTFTKKMPLLSESFQGTTNVSVCGDNNANIECLNNLQVYYMVNSTQDTLYGWAQDVNFLFNHLRKNHSNYLKSCSEDDRPEPSSNSNDIDIKMPRTSNFEAGVHYRIEWYNTETGERLFDSIAGQVVETERVKFKSFSGEN
jgi:hypothetical protein